MSELKTLEDLRYDHKKVGITFKNQWDRIACALGFYIGLEVLKKEAIKHIKSRKMVSGTKLWAIEFFDITEEDLK